jgi:predicted ATPase
VTSRRLHVLTGAPGTGKTAILDRLGGSIRCVGEPAREILHEERSGGGDATPQRDPSGFVKRLLRRSIEKRTEAGGWQGSVIFDRGIPDCVAYARVLGIDPEPSRLAAQRYRYDRGVFIVEPWDDIYSIDDERTITFEATLDFHQAIVDAYRDAGYDLLTVPRASVDDRAAFLGRRIASAAGTP